MSKTLFPAHYIKIFSRSCADPQGTALHIILEGDAASLKISIGKQSWPGFIADIQRAATVAGFMPDPAAIATTDAMAPLQALALLALTIPDDAADDEANDYRLTNGALRATRRAVKWLEEDIPF